MRSSARTFVRRSSRGARATRSSSRPHERSYAPRRASTALVVAALAALPTAAGAAIARLQSQQAGSGRSAAAVARKGLAPPVSRDGGAAYVATNAGGDETAQRHAPAACAARGVLDIRLRRVASGMHARLSWSAPRAGGAGVVYRVLREGRTVGQTVSDSIVLAVTPGSRTTFTVQARYEAPTRVCAAQLRELVPVRLPSRVLGLVLVRRTASGVLLGWRASKPGDAPIAGYRVSLDGKVAGDTRGRRYTLILNLARTHRVRVAAVDTRGRLGAASRELVIGAKGRPASASAPPSTPEGLSVSDVSESEATVWWVASRAGGDALAGYRVYRGGELVGQTSSTSMRLKHLAAPHTYAITVSAIDADGVESARSAPLELSTAHRPPSAPSMLAAARVSDTSATLSWQAGSAASGAVAGYLLFEDGEPVGVVQGQIVTVALASERTYTFTVRTMDSAGYLSAPSPELTVTTTHTPPRPPGGLSAAEVGWDTATVSWSPSTAVSGTIVGYRVFRDEVPVGETTGTEMTLEDLAPSSEYTITVSAVDSLGAVSEPSAPLALQTAEPPPTHGSVQAYVLASTDESFEDLEAHYEQIGVVYPTYYECGPDGTITGTGDALITDWALARKIEVLPRINCLDVPYEEEDLNSGAREKLFEAVLALCREDRYSGVQIDYENAPPSDRNTFTSFITELAARLHAQGEKLSTVVTAKYWNVPTGRAAMYDDAALSVPSDYIFVLDWGLHWVTSAPGSIDEYGWFKRVAEYTATMPNLRKFTLGMPLYGVDWPGEGGPQHPGSAMEYAEIAELSSQLGIAPEWEPTAQSPHFSYTDSEGVPHQVWYVDEQSLAARAQLADSLGLNVGLWRLGHEDQRIWELPQLGGAG